MGSERRPRVGSYGYLSSSSHCCSGEGSAGASGVHGAILWHIQGPIEVVHIHQRVQILGFRWAQHVGLYTIGLAQLEKPGRKCLSPWEAGFQAPYLTQGLRYNPTPAASRSLGGSLCPEDTLGLLQQESEGVEPVWRQSLEPHPSGSSICSSDSFERGLGGLNTHSQE